MHFIVSAPGYTPLTTHLFVRGDPYLDSDAVFGTKDSLVVDFVRSDSAEDAERHGVRAPFYSVEYDFVLRPEAETRPVGKPKTPVRYRLDHHPADGLRSPSCPQGAPCPRYRRPRRERQRKEAAIELYEVMRTAFAAREYTGEEIPDTGALRDPGPRPLRRRAGATARATG